jgi:hypothetical protein
MSILTFSAHKSASGKNVGYIMRDSACDEVIFHNLDDLADKNIFDAKVNALSYVFNREEEEKGRTHYRAVLSFENIEETQKVSKLTEKFLQENFQNAKAIIAIHQDTAHSHAHIWIDARQTDGKKIQISPTQFKNLDISYARLYDKEFGTNRAEEYQQKKQETLEWKRSQIGLRNEGKQPRPINKPARAEDKMNSKFFRTKEKFDRGVATNDERGTRRNQRQTQGKNSDLRESETRNTTNRGDFGASREESIANKAERSGGNSNIKLSSGSTNTITNADDSKRTFDEPILDSRSNRDTNKERTSEHPSRKAERKDSGDYKMSILDKAINLMQIIHFAVDVMKDASEEKKERNVIQKNQQISLSDRLNNYLADKLVKALLKSVDVTPPKMNGLPQIQKGNIPSNPPEKFLVASRNPVTKNDIQKSWQAAFNTTKNSPPAQKKNTQEKTIVNEKDRTLRR